MNNKIQKGNVGQVKPDVKISMSCRKASIRHLRIFVFDETVNKRKEKRRSPTETLGDDRPLCYNRINAFTLIELLVVVLIIGILAAVAVPQYQKAVERSKAAQALAIIRSVAAAQENYYLANGIYATNFNELAVDIPWTGTIRWIAGSSPTDGVRSNEDWSLQIFYEASGYGISVGRLTGPYAGAGFRYLLGAGSMNRPTRTMLCVENHYEGNGSIIFQQHSGNYCKKIMKGTYLYSDNWQL